MGKGSEGEEGIQVTPRPLEGLADRKSLFVGEGEFGCQRPMGPAGTAIEWSGPWVEKSRRSLVTEAVNMDENA